MNVVLLLEREVARQAMAIFSVVLNRTKRLRRIHWRYNADDVRTILQAEKVDLVVMPTEADWIPEGTRAIILDTLAAKEGLNEQGHFVMFPRNVTDEYAVTLALTTLGFLSPTPT